MNKRNFSFIVVNDSEVLRKTVTNTLKDEFPNSLFFQFPSGFEAKKWLMENSGEKNFIVITDLEMPHLDGNGVVQFIRKSPDLRDIPVIMISGYAGIKEIAEYWGCRFLKRPLFVEELLKIISEFTEQDRK